MLQEDLDSKLWHWKAYFHPADPGSMTLTTPNL